MADLGEFGQEVAPVGQDGEEVTPDTFTFHGEPFEIPAGQSVLPLLRFSYRAKLLAADANEAKRIARTAVTDAQKQDARRRDAQLEMDSNAILYEFLKAMLPDEDDWARFEKVAIRVGASQAELTHVSSQIVGAITGRPTKQPSGSPDGLSNGGDGSMDGSGSPGESASAIPMQAAGSDEQILTLTEQEWTNLTPRERQTLEWRAGMVRVTEAASSS